MKRLEEGGNPVTNKLVPTKMGHFLIPAIPIIVISIVAFRFLYITDVKVLGNDAMAHIYKVWLLSDQFREIRWPYLGIWDPNWYAGYPFLRITAPLFYFIAALLGTLSFLSPAEATRIIIFTTFPLSYLSMYICAKSITKDNISSIVGGLLYSLIPTHISIITLVGNFPPCLAYVFMPFVLLFTHRLLFRLGNNRNNLTFASLFLALVGLSHQGAGASLVLSLLILLFLVYSLLKKFNKEVLLIFPIAFLLSLNTLSSVSYALNYAPLDLKLTRPIPPFSESFLEFLLPVNYTSLGLAGLVFGVTLPLVTRLKQKKWNVSSVYAFCSLLILAIFVISLYPNFVNVTIISAIAGRLHHVIPVFIALSLACFLSSFRNVALHKPRINRKSILLVIIVGLLLIEATSVPIYTSPSADRYTDAYEFFKSDPSWFRVFQVPRQPAVGAITMYTGKPVIDGWYDVIDRNLYYVILRTISYAGMGLEGYGWGDFVHNTDGALSILRFLGVKYVVIDSVDPVYPPGVSKSIYMNVNGSNLVELVGYDEKNWVYTFKLKEWYPIIVSRTAFVLSNGGEVEAFYEIASDSDFDPRSGIFVSKHNDLEQVPHSIWGEDTLSVSHVDYAVHWIVTDHLSMSILTETQESAFVYIPVSYYDGLRVSVNGREVSPLRALPSFIAIYLPSGGIHHIVISRKTTLQEGIFLLLLFLTIGAIIVFSQGLIKDERFHKRSK